MFDLNNGNFLIYAAKCYESPHLLQKEFDEDLNRIKYIKRILRKYRDDGDCKERLMLNHIIVMSNVFGVEPTVNMLFFKVDSQDYPTLKTFLIFLNYMPDEFMITFNKYFIKQKEIPIDLNIAERLRKI